MDYINFIANKRHSIGESGFKADYFPEISFDFQKYIIEKAVSMGRCAIFADTGLGKTLIQLSIAQNIVRKTKGKVIILTPLAVAFQFIEESKKIGLDNVEYSKDGKFTKDIIICNYERIHYFEPNDFKCVICDESSILKNFDGKIKTNITSFMKKTDYRFLCTATPSPNDYIELGTSSEALGHLGYMDMLSKFFRNNQNTIKSSQVVNAKVGSEWYLKPHAEKDFWVWVNQWSISIKKPSDLGFSDENYKLPKLHEIKTIVKNDKVLDVDGQLQIFNQQAMSFKEIKSEVRNTIEKRCEAAVMKARERDTTVYWVNLNDEAKAIRDMDKDAVEICGSMSIEKKEDILMAFSRGEVKKLVTKTKITAFGLNWQHCNHTTYFPTYSFEQYYQAIRRFWRFGQKKEVFVDLILSDGQKRVMETLELKKQKAIEMFEELSKNANKKYEIKVKPFDKQIIKPSFL